MSLAKLIKLVKEFTELLFCVSTTLVALDVVVSQILELLHKVISFF